MLSQPTTVVTRRSLHLTQAVAAAPEQPISRLMSDALKNPGLISLAAGFVDEQSLPCQMIEETIARLLRNPMQGRQSLQYGLTEGDANLRLLIAQRYFAGCHDQHAANMVLTAGSNQLLHLITQCLLEPGDLVLCAAPTYFVYLAILRDLGVDAVSIATDDAGMIPEALDETLSDLNAQGQRERIKLLYLVPYFDNPAATTMTIHRRQEILHVLERHQTSGPPIALLADNAYRDLRYDGIDEPCFVDCGADPALTIETGTFSKNLAPGIRVGWGVLPEPLRTGLLRRKSVIDFGSPSFSQAIVRQLMLDGLLDDHLEGSLLPTYQGKRDAMVAACQRQLSAIEGVHFQAPQGGLYVWLQLPPEIAASPGAPLWNACLHRGVLYVPGELCFASEGAKVQRNTIRLSFGVQSEAGISKGIELLAQAITEVGVPGTTSCG